MANPDGEGYVTSEHLLQGIDDVHNHILQYLFNKYKTNDVSKLDIYDDLYDKDSKVLKEFTIVLAAKTVAMFDNNSKHREQVEWARWSTRSIFALLIIGAVATPVTIAAVFWLMLKYGYLDKALLVKYLLITGVFTSAFLSFLIVLAIRINAELRRLNDIKLIDLRSQVSNTQLLWDSSIRYLFYNTLPEDDKEQHMAKDKAVANRCDDPNPLAPKETPNMTKVKVRGDEACARPFTDINKAYLNELMGWIVKFYDNRDEIEYQVKTLDPQDTVRRLAKNAEIFSKLIRKGKDAPGANRASATVVKEVIQNEIIPLLTVEYVRFNAATVTDPEQYGRTVPSSADACVDKCIEDPDCRMSSFDGKGCNLHKSTNAFISAGQGDSSVNFKKGNVSPVMTYIQGGIVADKRIISTHATRTDCLTACSLEPECDGCYQATEKGQIVAFAANNRDELNGKTSVPSKTPCKIDCHLIKRTYEDMPFQNHVKELSRRQTHLADKLARIYMKHNVHPMDAYHGIMESLKKETTSSEVEKTYKTILNTAETRFNSLANVRYHVDKVTFSLRLQEMTVGEFVKTIALPSHEINIAARAINDRVLIIDDALRSRMRLAGRGYDALIANIAIAGSAFMAYILYSREDGERTLQDNQMFAMKMGLILTLIVFACVLVWSIKTLHSKNSTAHRLASKQSGTRLMSQVRALYTKIHKDGWMTDVLGVDGLTINENTGRISVDGRPFDENADYAQKKLNWNVLGDNLDATLTTLRDLIITMDDTVKDCNDLLNIRTSVVFPWSEVVLIMLGLGLAVAILLATNYYVRPGDVLDRLKTCMRGRAWVDQGMWSVEFDETKDFYIQMLIMGMGLFGMMTVSYLVMWSASEYTARTPGCTNTRYRNQDDV
jgi:hypothetical protein